MSAFSPASETEPRVGIGAQFVSESLRLWWVEMAPHAWTLAIVIVGVLVALALGSRLFRN
jgi:hypothetical protein